MQVTMLKGKIHRATVTQADVAYVGSITLDPCLIEAAGMFEYERVQVADVENGARFETYIIAGERGSGIVCLNGAAARLVNVGDPVIVMSYASMTPDEAADFHPRVVFVDDENRIVRVASYERHGKLQDQ